MKNLIQSFTLFSRQFIIFIYYITSKKTFWREMFRNVWILRTQNAPVSLCICAVAAISSKIITKSPVCVPVSLAAIYVQARTDPPQCLTDDVCFGPNAVLLFLHTFFFPSFWQWLTLVALVHRTLFQNTVVCFGEPHEIYQGFASCDKILGGFAHEVFSWSLTRKCTVHLHSGEHSWPELELTKYFPSFLTVIEKSKGHPSRWQIRPLRVVSRNFK